MEVTGHVCQVAEDREALGTGVPVVPGMLFQVRPSSVHSGAVGSTR